MMRYVPTYFNRNINIPELIIYDPIPLAGRFSLNCIWVFGIFEKSKKKYLHKQTQAESELTCREVQDLWTRGLWVRHQ